MSTFIICAVFKYCLLVLTYLLLIKSCSSLRTTRREWFDLSRMGADSKFIDPIEADIQELEDNLKEAKKSVVDCTQKYQDAQKATNDAVAAEMSSSTVVGSMDSPGRNTRSNKRPHHETVNNIQILQSSGHNFDSILTDSQINEVDDDNLGEED